MRKREVNMKSIATLFFALTLIMTFTIAFGVSGLNELQVVRPEKNAPAVARAVVSESAGTYVKGVSADNGTYKTFMITTCADEAALGFSAETEHNS
jgi:hypothetical protein